jgi:diguanylate cyclase (GGDEF)-like protein
MKSLKMTIVGLGTYTWFMYFGISTKSKMVNSEKKRILMFLPIIFQVLIDYVLIFTFDLNRKDIIGYISSFVLILVPLLYMIHTSGSTCILYLKNKNDNVRKDTLVYLIYPIVLVIVAILQVIISDLPVICFGTSIAMLALYINRLGDMISLDPLTGTYNRNALIKGLNDLFKNDEKIYCFIMDLDRFKQINDKFGHIEGDEALVKFSNILKKTCDNPNLLFGRYGGDEFVIFAKNYNDELAKELIDKIQNNLKEAQAESKKYVMQISIGYAQKAEYESIRALIERADKMLYEIKRKKKNKNTNKK